MPKGRKPPKPKPQQLLVEGKNDRHVIWALCQKYQLPKVFSVEVPSEEENSLENDGQGIELLLKGIPDRLRQENLQTLGIVVDADLDLSARWQSVSDRLKSCGYTQIPSSPPADGWVYEQSELPRIGVWLMPDNQLSGMLEDFVARLMSPDDNLRPKADTILEEIEREQLNRYTSVHHAKALIHTWLAWQKKPGMPMGQAITAQVLGDDETIALAFVKWLDRLFNPNANLSTS
ncbi:hypothetical protein IQ235_16125 [Oscillatoriales cyanobacterium LEGE 11467]|uniref:Uncharacterized protein n=1 Tax=Zarconia navalis LEGE 11467 TaxID=1828826 RepID=A0A928VY82_9CYAN|nr:hypothetical protein [Zarconia navalis LEGE 11467]